MATVAVDPSTPLLKVGVAGGGTTTQSNSFSPPGGGLLAVFAENGNNSTGVASISDSLASHLTYQKVIAVGVGGASTTEIWVADLPATAPGAMTVTVTWAASLAALQDTAVGVHVLTGTASATSIVASGHTASASNSAFSVTFTAAAADSWLFAAATDWNAADTPTFTAPVTDVFNGLTQAWKNATSGTAGWVMGNNAPGNANLTLATTTPAGTSTDSTVVGVEILAASGGGGGGGAAPPFIPRRMPMGV